MLAVAATLLPRALRAQARPTLEIRMTGGPTRAFGSWGGGLELSGALILGSHLLQARNSLGIDLSYASTGSIYGSSSRSVISIVASWRSEFIPPHGGVRSYLQAGVGVVGSDVTVPNLALVSSYGGQPAPSGSAWGPTATGGVGALFTVTTQVDVQVGGEVALQNIYAGYYSPIVRGLVGFVFRE
jgi:hypothetical protein